jgi:CelD/BcsL family acetyltransferase involved in cellulose biosynthesis
VLPVGDLASNYWSASGELLLDPAADAEAALGLVADALQETPWPLLWLDLVPLATARWQSLAEMLARRGLRVAPHVRYQIGQVEVGHDFAAFEAGLSKNLRRSLHKDLRRLERSGPAALRLIREFAPGEVRTRLREVFELETRSWKSQPGQAVLKTPGMFDFYCRQAEQLAAWGCLRVALLEHGGEATCFDSRTGVSPVRGQGPDRRDAGPVYGGRPIAGELGWVAKGVYHSFKVAYDEAFGEFGPGHLLRMFLVEEFCRARGAQVIDFQGPLTDALASWATRSYPIGRLVIAPKRLASRILFAGYRTTAVAVRRLRPGSC